MTDNFSPNLGFTTLREEPSLPERIGSKARAMFFGEQDPRKQSVMDSKFIPMKGAPKKYESIGSDLAMPLATAYHGGGKLFREFKDKHMLSGTGDFVAGAGH